MKRYCNKIMRITITLPTRRRKMIIKMTMRNRITTQIAFNIKKMKKKKKICNVHANKRK